MTRWDWTRWPWSTGRHVDRWLADSVLARTEQRTRLRRVRDVLATRLAETREALRVVTAERDLARDLVAESEDVTARTADQLGYAEDRQAHHQRYGDDPLPLVQLPDELIGQWRTRTGVLARRRWTHRWMRLPLTPTPCDVGADECLGGTPAGQWGVRVESPDGWVGWLCRACALTTAGYTRVAS